MHRTRVFILLGLLVLSSTPVFALQLQQEAGLRWVSGGVGKAERQQMQQLSKDFNVRLLFASDQGHFFSDALVEVLNADDQLLMQGRGQGPYFLMDMPAGTYQVKATVKGMPQSKTLVVPEGGGQQRLQFRWQYEDEKAEIVPSKPTVIWLPPKSVAADEPATSKSTSAEAGSQAVSKAELQASRAVAPTANVVITGLYSSLKQVAGMGLVGVELLISQQAGQLQGFLQCANGEAGPAQIVALSQNKAQLFFSVPEPLRPFCPGRQFQGVLEDDALVGQFGAAEVLLPRRSSYWNLSAQ